MMRQKLRNPGRACRLKNPLRFRSRNSCSTVHSILLFLNLINSRSISRMRPRGSPSRNHWREGNVFPGEIENACEETSAAAAAAAAVRKINRLPIARYSRSLHKWSPSRFPARCYFFWFLAASIGRLGKLLATCENSFLFSMCVLSLHVSKSILLLLSK